MLCKRTDLDLYVISDGLGNRRNNRQNCGLRLTSRGLWSCLHGWVTMVCSCHGQVKTSCLKASSYHVRVTKNC